MIWVVINVASMNLDVRIPQASTLIVASGLGASRPQKGLGAGGGGLGAGGAGVGHSLGVGWATGWLGAWVGGWVGEWLGAENPFKEL